jgi:hypothetical protein
MQTERYNNPPSYNQLGRRRHLSYHSMFNRPEDNMSDILGRNRLIQNSILNRYSTSRNPFVIDLDSPRLVEREGMDHSQDISHRICYMHTKVIIYYYILVLPRL